MLRRHSQNDYQPVTRSRGQRALEARPGAVKDRFRKTKPSLATDLTKETPELPIADHSNLTDTFLKRGHGFSYAALFLFTVVLYARPGEFYPSPLTASIALIVGLLTLGLFIPTQLALESNLTASLREVNLVLLFGLAGLLSIPLAINRSEAWLG